MRHCCMCAGVRIKPTDEFLLREIEKLQEYCLKLEETNKRFQNDSMDKNTRLFNSEQENKRLVAENFRLQDELNGIRKMWGAIK